MVLIKHSLGFHLTDLQVPNDSSIEREASAVFDDINMSLFWGGSWPTRDRSKVGNFLGFPRNRWKLTYFRRLRLVRDSRSHVGKVVSGLGEKIIDNHHDIP